MNYGRPDKCWKQRKGIILVASLSLSHMNRRECSSMISEDRYPEQQCVLQQGTFHLDLPHGLRDLRHVNFMENQNVVVIE